MGKNKKPLVEAPKVETPKQEKPAVNVVQVGDIEKMMKPSKTNGMDLNHVVDALTGAKEMLHDNPHAAEYYGMPEEAVKKMNKITAIGFVTAIAVEMQTGTDEWAKRMNRTQLEALKEVAPMIGVDIDMKLLPAPAADGTIELPKEAIKISKETKKALSEEAKKKIPTNPTEVETEEQLKDALTAFLSDPKITRPFERFMRAINFYRSYLTIQANKSENKDVELEKVKNTSDAELLQDISTMATCPIIVQGFGNYLRGTVEDTKNIIHAFCAFRDASKNRATGLPAIDDNAVAEIVRVLIIWSCNEKIKEQAASIKKTEDGLEVLKKDEKANEKAIESETKKIAGYKTRISFYQDLIGVVNAPSFDVVDSFVNDYLKKESENWATAHKYFGIVLNSYYPGAQIDETTVDTALLNVQQRMGIIVNLFNDAVSQNENYSLENLKDQPEETKDDSKKE